MLIFICLLLGACAPSSGSSTLNPRTAAGFAPRMSGTYVLTIVSGDNQTGNAVMVFNPPVTQVTSTTFTLGPSQSTTLPLPLVVEVRDQSGALADGFEVRFTPEYDTNGIIVGPIGLGTSVTGWAWHNSTITWPSTPGRAAVLAQPYYAGPQRASCVVEPPATSNTVAFTVYGQ